MALDIDFLMADYNSYVNCHEADCMTDPPGAGGDPLDFGEWLVEQPDEYIRLHSFEVDD